MQNLKLPVSSLPQIGPKYQKLLSKLEIETVEDLIYYFPFRYENYSEIKPVGSLEINEPVTIEGTVLEIKNIFTKNKKKLTKAVVADNSGKVELTWFNQHYLTSSIKEGDSYFFSGKVSTFNNKKVLISPQFEKTDKKNVNTGGLIPVYSETKGLSSKWLRARIYDTLNNTVYKEALEDILPQEIIKKEKFPELQNSLNAIHFPEDESKANEAKKRFAFEELFLELLKVEKRKAQWHNDFEGIKLNYNSHKEKLNEFIKSLPFKLTNAQNKVLEEIHKDLTLNHPMNRLLEGDVGSGKTVVAIVASYLNHLCGYKTLYMAPTEILANQHYQTYKDFLKNFNVEIKLQTGNTKSDVTSSKEDIIIGTHALLYTKNKIENVGLVIIDEQHRFGVEQRTKLAQSGTGNIRPNLLTMTATPIPRTLALTLYGDLDISILDAVPNKDKKITTKVIPENYREKSFKWIKARGEQAFIVCPFIQESEAVETVKAAEIEYERLKKGIFSDINIGLLHGRMTPKEKQQIMEEFRNKKYQVLVSTPVIEVGVDVPEATIMVIESAERYGLASLHQLRGRVGRGRREGFCFLFMSTFSKKGFARLKNLESINSGLKLAEIDMQYRGQGDIFGTLQHGYKKFKVADLSDIELIEKAKAAAQSTYKKIYAYPRLMQYITDNDNKIAKN